MESRLASKCPSSDRVSSNLNGCSHIVSSNLIGCSHIFLILSFITIHTFYLVITYIKLPLPTHDTMIIRLWDGSPLHMLPYPTHVHPTTGACGHAYSHPNPNDHNFRKNHKKSRLASLLTNVRARTRVWRTTIMKIITQGQEWEHNAKKKTQPKATREGRILHESQSQQKTIHHEITQPTSIWEYRFYTNPNDVTRPKVMNPSVHKTKAKVQNKP